jgi:hypothetical protein
MVLPMGVALACACSTSPAPTQRLADTQAAIREASRAGADRNPQASVHMKLARERQSEASRLSAKGDNAQAEELLEQAQVDAELGAALARRDRATARAIEARAQLDQLPTQVQP